MALEHAVAPGQCIETVNGAAGTITSVDHVE